MKCLIFKTERTVQIVTVGYFKKCDTFQLPYSRFCEAMVSFEERKGYNFKELQFTSLYLKSKIDNEIEIEHCCFLPIGRRSHDFSKLSPCNLEVVTLYIQDTSEQTHLRGKLTVKIFIKIRQLSLYIS